MSGGVVSDEPVHHYPDVFAGILVGGRGRRLGGIDKARLLVDGEPNVRRLIATVHQRLDLVRLAGRAEQSYPEVDAPLVVDARPDSGPLAGLEALLDAAPRPHCFLVACDLVHFDAALIDLVCAVRTQAPIIVPRLPSGLEPTCALYSTKILGAVRAALDRGERALHRLVRSQPHLEVEVPPQLRVALHNVNSPADLPAGAPDPERKSR